MSRTTSKPNQVGYEVVWATKSGQQGKVVSTLKEAIDLFGKKKTAGYGSPCYHVAMGDGKPFAESIYPSRSSPGR
jgi:hypothetical protein